MRVERTMMAADVTAGMTSRSPSASTAAAASQAVTTPSAGATGPAPAQPGAPARVERAQEASQAQRAPAAMAGLSAGDRAAIASATGFYIGAGGKVTPEGMPPWGFIVKYVEQRQEERAPDTGSDAVQAAAPVIEGERVDITV